MKSDGRGRHSVEYPIQIDWIGQLGLPSERHALEPHLPRQCMP